MQWVLLAPGPSMSESLANRVRGQNVGAVGNAYQLAPWADFLAATDRAWWDRHPEAKAFKGKRYSPNCLPCTERVHGATVFSGTNSGVLALECARRNGATRILLLGFDMHGSHFFGPYTNGLRNTTDARRRQHLVQYAQWRRVNKDIEVLNCTDGSALKCFPMARLDECLT